MRLLVWLALLAGISTTNACPALAIPPTLPQAQGTSSEDLNRFLDSTQKAIDEVTASRKEASLARVLEEMRIPDSEKWFADTFGSENGSGLAAKYAQTVGRDEKRMLGYFAGNAPSGGKVTAELVSGASNASKTQYLQGFDDNLLKAVRQPTEFYRFQYVWTNDQGNPTKYTIGYLAHVNGQYSLVSDTVLRTLPGMPSIRIRQGGAITAASLIRRVRPVYPPEAQRLHVKGTVRLHVVIANDGNIKDIEVVSGDSLLVPVTIDAVRQWLYRPTFLNGEPVEVDTTVDVVFD